MAIGCEELIAGDLHGVQVQALLEEDDLKEDDINKEYLKEDNLKEDN